MDQPSEQGDASASRTDIDWRLELARHDRWLRTVVAARLRDRAAVDDVMQEVSLAALAGQAPVRDADRAAPWLYRVALLQVLMHRRKQGRQRKLTERFAARVEPVESFDQADPLEWLLGDERRQLIRRALARLNGRDAEILLLKYTEEWSYQQIAARFGVSASAVEARLHRARARMRAELAALNVIEVVR